MNKHSVIAIILAIILGICVGWFGKTEQSNKEQLKLQDKHEKELVEQNKASEVKIQQLNQTILDLSSRNKQDSTTIAALKYKIEKDGVVVKQKLEEVQKLNSDEKAQWLIDRYNH